MADCSGLITNEDLQNAKIDAASSSEFVSSGNPTLKTRLGAVKKTVQGMNDDAATQLAGFESDMATGIASAGWDLKGNFATSITINNANEVLNYNDILYRCTDTLPITTDGATPGADSHNWLTVSLEELKQIARSLNVSDNAIIYDTDTVTPIPTYIYSPSQQKTYSVPAGAIGKTINSVVGSELNTVEAGGPYELFYSVAPSSTVDIRVFGAHTSKADNTSSILAAVEHIKSIGGGCIEVEELYEYTQPTIIDTSGAGINPIVQFKGTSTRNTGFKYMGPDSATEYAFQIGVEGVGSTGFAQMYNIGIYGNGQDIDAVAVFKGQRWSVLDDFTVRNFNGMMLTVPSGDVFLNTWGSIFLLNGSRGAKLGSEFNANTIANIVIENMTLVTSRYGEEVPVLDVDGIGTTISTVSIENCPSDIMMKLTETITVVSLYQENNHARNIGVGARCLQVSGTNSKVLAGNVKVPGVNANTSDFYVVDLMDSNKANISFALRTPTANPNSFQKPITWGTSSNAEIDIQYQMFDGVGYPSRNETTAFQGENRSNNVVSGVQHIFGQDPELVGRELMTKYSLWSDKTRCIYPNSDNRPSGHIESNLDSGSIFSRDLGFSNRKDTLKASGATASDYGVYIEGNLSPNHKYLFSTIVGRPATTTSVPRMRIQDTAGTQDYLVLPSNPFFTGWTQISLVTTLSDATDVRFWDLTSTNGAGDTYLAMSFVIDLEAYESDHGVTFDGMTTREIENLLNPSYVSEEFSRQFRSGVPNKGVWARGERVYRYPPTSGQPEGYVCATNGDFDLTPPTFLSMANLS